MAYYEMSDIAAAETAYRTVLRLEPRSLAAMVGLADVFNRQRRADEALALLAQAGSPNANAGAAIEQTRGTARLIKAETDAALAHFERALALAPSFSKAAHSRAIALEKLGRTEEALSAYRKVVADTPGNLGAHQGLNQLLYRLKRQKRGHIVGMTGDGVNDAPALKKADCGIAVSGATDAARAAAAIVLMTPGLSVIIDAIKESRKIFQRMNSYAIYRIAETLRVLLFMTVAILIFNFYPLTAVMIVMLALLNDGAILSIAYDNVHYKDAPEAWNMRLVLGIATVLGARRPDRCVRPVFPR